MATTPVTFNNDILPIVGKWRSQMIWRLDLTKYEDVKMNADIIYTEISSGPMPPPPYPPLSNDQINLFKQWMNDGCPE
jgi:hypothetical protein